uniref:PGG domain-containing protein n=1 Tax=Brassica campestris TaxID=3711 RepID=M4DIS1_BRACM
MDDGGRYTRRAAPTLIIALIVMFNTLGPILAPPTNLNASNRPPGTTEAEFRAKKVATKMFWAFSNTAFALSLAAALVQIGKRIVHGTREVCEKVSFMLVMVALLFMSFAAIVVSGYEKELRGFEKEIEDVKMELKSLKNMVVCVVVFGLLYKLFM